MRGLDRFLSILSLLLILLNAAGQVLTARSPAVGLGGYGLYLYAQAAVFLAVWFLARDRNTQVGLILAASASILVSWPFTAIIGGELVNLYSLAYAIPFQWLLAALTAASAAARRAPQAAGLRLYKTVVAGLALIGLGLRVMILVMADSLWEPTTPVYSFEPLEFLINYLVVPVLLPLWLLRAAGRRAGPSFTAGLAVILPTLATLAILWVGRGGPADRLYVVLDDSMGLTINMLLWLFILTALTALWALVRDRRAVPETPAPKPVGQLKMSAALVAAGALVLVFFLALGYHQSRRMPPTADYTGPMKNYKFADMEIKVPADIERSHVQINPVLDGERFFLTEMVRSSAEEIEARISQIHRPAGKNYPAVQKRDLSLETGRPSGLAAAGSDRKSVSALNLTMFVRYGDTGLVTLKRWVHLDPAPGRRQPGAG